MSPSSEGCLQTLVRIQKGRAKQTSQKRVLMQDSSNPDEQTYFFHLPSVKQNLFLSIYRC